MDQPNDSDYLLALRLSQEWNNDLGESSGSGSKQATKSADLEEDLTLALKLSKEWQVENDIFQDASEFSTEDADLALAIAMQKKFDVEGQEDAPNSWNWQSEPEQPKISANKYRFGYNSAAADEPNALHNPSVYFMPSKPSQDDIIVISSDDDEKPGRKGKNGMKQVYCYQFCTIINKLTFFFHSFDT